MEASRMDRMKLVLGAFVELQRSVAPEVESCCDRMNALVSNIDPTSVCIYPNMYSTSNKFM